MSVEDSVRVVGSSRVAADGAMYAQYILPTCLSWLMEWLGEHKMGITILVQVFLLSSTYVKVASRASED